MIGPAGKSGRCEALWVLVPWFAVCLTSGVHAGGASDAERAVRERVAGVPGNAAAIWWDAFDAMPALSSEEQRAMADGTFKPRNAEEFDRRLARSLELQARAAGMTACDWGVDYSEGPGATLPHLAKVRQLERLTLWEAARRMDSDPSGAASLVGNTLAMTRHLSADPSLISMLLGIACESQAYEFVAGNLHRFPPADLARLEAALPPADKDDRWAKAMQCEKEAMVGWLIRKLTSLSASNLQERAAGGTAGRLASDIRLNAMIEITGHPLQIGLEFGASGQTVWLRPGQTRNGVTLVSADMASDEAVVSRGDEKVVIHLKSREVRPLQVDLTDKQAAELSALFGVSAEGEGGAEARKMLVKLGGPDGILEGLRHVQQYEDDLSRLDGWVEPEKLRAMSEEAISRSGALGKLLLPAFENAYASFFAARVRGRMMRAAMRMRAGDATALQTVTDPADGRPFDVKPTPDGYELVSRATKNKEPVTLKVRR